MRSPHLLLALETALAAAAGLLFLGSKGFSGDESVSVTLARLPWNGLEHVVARRETNGSLYFMLLHALTGGRGGEEAVRAVSVACAVLAVPVLFLLARRLFGTRIALAAGLLLALDPLEVEYSQVAREYVLAVLLVLVSTYLFVRGVQDRSPWAWAGYSIVSALAAYAFLLSAAVPAAHALSLAALPRRRVPWRQWGAAAAGAGALLIPLVVLLAGSEASGGIAWASGNLPGRIVVSLRSGIPRPAIAAVVLVVTAAAAFVAWRALGRLADDERAWPVVLVAAWLLVPSVLVAAAGFVYQPLFVVRYFLVFSPPLVIGVAAVLARLRRPVALAAAGASVALVAGVGLAHWYSGSAGSDFRSAGAYVEAGARPGDGVLIYAPYVRVPFELYFERTAAAKSGAVRPVYPPTPWGRDPARFIEFVPMRRASVAQALAGYRQVWLVLAQYRLYGRRDQGYDNVIAALSSRGLRLTARRSFPGVEVRRYEAPS